MLEILSRQVPGKVESVVLFDISTFECILVEELFLNYVLFHFNPFNFSQSQSFGILYHMHHKMSDCELRLFYSLFVSFKPTCRW